MPEAQVDQAFQALDDAFAEYANAKNADELAEAYYAEDASVLPPNHPRVNGQPQIRDFWKGAIDQGLTDVLLNLLEVHEAGDFAWGIGEYSLAIAPSGQVVRDSGKYLLVFRRQADGAWKVAVDMWSSNQPAS